MRYILIANNKKLSDYIINLIDLKDDDIIILFNDMFALKYDKIKYFPNKWWIGRQTPFKQEMPFRSFAGLDLVKEHESLFQKIIVHSCPCAFDTVKNKTQRFLQERVDSYNFDPSKLDCLEPFSNGVRKMIGYPKGKNMSSGIITYGALQVMKKPTDQIALVGFTSELTKSFHNDIWEANFFRNEINRGRCLSYGSYGLEKEKYNTIYNDLKWTSYLKGNHGDKSIELIKKLKPKSILDVGCGPNLFCKNTVKELCDCQGLDFAGKWQDIEADLCEELLYIRNKQFDMVTAFDVMEHLLLSCVDSALSEMQRISNQFVMQIDYNKKSSLVVLGSSLHPTVKSKKWWIDKIFEFAEFVEEQDGYLYGKWKTK